jgi:predicted TIM-barrel fold metal-dependent hydrolase
MATSPNRIDVHQHSVPPAWASAMDDRGLTSGGWRRPAWSADAAVAMMDEHGIATGILSAPAPGVNFGDDSEGRSLARTVNEFGAELMKDHPRRFGLFASVPLPDVDGALQEATYALDTLGADGVVLFSNAGGRYLGDPAFEVLWAELDRRQAVVFVHPNQPDLPMLDGTPAPLVDYPFDTTRSAIDLVLKGVMRRYQNVRVILSHGGGFLPYAAYRFSVLTSMVTEPGRDAEELMEDMRRFYFDTALTPSPTALPALLAFARPGHILYGSDWPYAPATVGEFFNQELESCDLSAEEAFAINRGASEELFPRLVVAASDTAPNHPPFRSGRALV